MDQTLVIRKELPPEAYLDELVAIDLEIYGIPEGKLHRPVGTFACCSVYMERDVGTQVVYQFYDSHDIPEAIRRLQAGKWVFQNGMFDLRQLRRWTTVEPRPMWDTKIVDQGLWGGYYSRFDLGALSLRYLHEAMDKSVRDEFPTATSMTEEMEQYAALDPIVTMRVALEQMNYIDDNEISMDHYWKADLPATWAILDMPPALVDVNNWEALAKDFSYKAKAIQDKYDFNIGSPLLVNKKLQSILRLRSPLRSTDEETITDLMEHNKGREDIIRFCTDLLEFRKAKKLSSTYGETWLKKYTEDNGLVYSDWKPCQASTGRLSSSSPNLQNIPAREFPIFRSFFIAGDGSSIVVADVAQQEPRILAKLSGDKNLTDVLVKGDSPHLLVGQYIFNDPNFSKADPRYAVAKQLNLAMSYGLTASGLAVRAGLSEEDAQSYLESYFKLFPGVRLYMDKYRDIALRRGYVQTLLGRRSWVNPYSTKWMNNAINAPVQGTGGDQIKIAMGFVHQESKRRGLPFCLTMVVHDEMVVRVPNEYKDAYAQLINDAWQYAGELTLGDTIPMKLEIAIGDNWGCKG